MKRTISLWLGLLAFALLPALAQTPAAPTALKGPTGKIHGHITGPEGTPKTSGTVSLSNDGGHTNKFTFQVTSSGDYVGEANTGTYTVVYRQADTPPDKFVDSIDNVKIVAGQDLLQDFDMTRKDYIDKLPADQQKQLEEIKKKNAEAMQANEVIKHLNDDLKLPARTSRMPTTARQTAVQTLGATASKADIDAREAEIRTAKYTEVETLMLKDTAAKPDASVLWAQLGQAQCLRPEDAQIFDVRKQASRRFSSLRPHRRSRTLQAQGAAKAGLGEIYARTGKVAEANAAFDAAAKINPPRAVLLSEERNGDLLPGRQCGCSSGRRGRGHQGRSDRGRSLLPEGQWAGQQGHHRLTQDKQADCARAAQEAYREVSATGSHGPYAADVKSILARLQATLPYNVRTKSSKKK